MLSGCTGVELRNAPQPTLTSIGGAPAQVNPAVVLPASTLPPTFTPAPTYTLLPSETPTLDPTPTPTPHPMSIAALRARDYPGSPITIERELDSGPNYYRYYASYLSDGLRIYALLTVPYGDLPEGGWPAIVFNHGYIPPSVYRTTERYINYVGNLAQNDYIVFRIDYRGHDQSEGSPSGAYGDPGYTVDVLNAVASIKQFPQANPEKIGMWGHSMGGFLTLRAMVISPDVKAGAIWAGVVGSYPDMLYRWRRGSGPTRTPPPTARGWRAEWIAQYGAPEDNPAFWDSVSANAHLAELSGPVLLAHGEEDADVPLEFSEILDEQIRAAGKTVELHVYPGADHNIAQSFTAAMGETIRFYDQYLK